MGGESRAIGQETTPTLHNIIVDLIRELVGEVLLPLSNLLELLVDVWMYAYAGDQAIVREHGNMDL